MWDLFIVPTVGAVVNIALFAAQHFVFDKFAAKITSDKLLVTIWVFLSQWVTPQIFFHLSANGFSYN